MGVVNNMKLTFVWSDSDGEARIDGRSLSAFMRDGGSKGVSTLQQLDFLTDVIYEAQKLYAELLASPNVDTVTTGSDGIKVMGGESSITINGNEEQ